MRDEDPGKLADELRREADDLHKRSRALEDEVEGVRQDWQRKRADAAVPGAPQEEGDRSDDAGETREASDNPEQASETPEASDTSEQRGNGGA